MSHQPQVNLWAGVTTIGLQGWSNIHAMNVQHIKSLIKEVLPQYTWRTSQLRSLQTSWRNQQRPWQQAGAPGWRAQQQWTRGWGQGQFQKRLQNWKWPQCWDRTSIWTRPEKHGIPSNFVISLEKHDGLCKDYGDTHKQKHGNGEKNSWNCHSHQTNEVKWSPAHTLHQKQLWRKRVSWCKN